MRISDWSSDVCSSDLGAEDRGDAAGAEDRADIVEDRAGSERHPEAIDGQVHANLRCRSSSARKKGAPISAIATPSRTSPGPGARRHRLSAARTSAAPPRDRKGGGEGKVGAGR